MAEFFQIVLQRSGALSAVTPVYRFVIVLVVVLGGSGIGLFFWVMPAQEQLARLHSETQQRESTLRTLQAQQPHSSADGQSALQAQLAMYPTWRSTRSEHDRLSELVGLASKHQLETLQLRAAPEREASSTLLSRQQIRQLEQADMPLEVLQHGYRWQLQGNPQGVMTLLDHLTRSAASIDELSVERVAPIGGRSSRNSDQIHSKDVTGPDPTYTEAPVRLDLAFRHFVVKIDDSWPQSEPAPFLAEAGVAERQSHRDGQTKAWTGLGMAPATGRCIPNAIDQLKDLNNDDPHILTNQQIEHITLVGIVEIPVLGNTESGRNRLRAVFLGRRGELLAAETGSKIALKGYRLVSLDHQQVVLQGPDIDAPNNHRVLALYPESLPALFGVEQISAVAAVR